MATTTTILPDSIASNNGWVSGTYGSTSGTVVTSVNDANTAADVTFVRKSATIGGLAITYNLANPGTVPAANQFVWYVQPKLRLIGGTTCALTAELVGVAGASSFTGAQGRTFNCNFTSVGTTATFVSSTGAPHGLSAQETVIITGTNSANIDGARTVGAIVSPTTFTIILSTSTNLSGTAIAYQSVVLETQRYYRTDAGATFVQTDLDNLQLRLLDSTGDQYAHRAHLFRASVDIVTASNPTVNSLTITGATTTTRPSISWTFSQTSDQIPASGIRIVVYPSSVPNPTVLETPGWVYDSGVISGQTNSHQITTDLLNNTSYNFYVRGWLALDGSSVLDVATAWASVNTTISLVAPTVPSTFTATWNQSTQQVTGTVSGSTRTGGGTITYQLQRSDDGGTTWVNVRNFSSFSGGSYTDREALRGTATTANTVRYRARAIATLSGGVIVTGNFTTVLTVSALGNGQWMFRNLAVGGTDYGNANVLSAPSESRAEDIEIVRPIGRSLPIVLRGELGGVDSQIAFYIPYARWSAFEPIMNSQVAVLLQSPFGTQRVFAITSRQWSRIGKGDTPDYVASLSVSEISSGT